MSDDPPVRLENLDGSGDGRRYSPSAGRNREAIVAALVDELPPGGTCLEVAAGTGEHAVLAATKLPQWTWLPTDRDAEALASIRAWVAHAGLPNLRAPTALALDGSAWPLRARIAGCGVREQRHAHRADRDDGGVVRLGGDLSAGRWCVAVYGPVFLPDEPRPAGNVAFDADLRAQDSAYGVRTLAELRTLAQQAGLTEPMVRRMPTNNVLLRFRRASA